MKKLAVLTLSALAVLSGCSSGGGGNDSQDQPPIVDSDTQERFTVQGVITTPDGSTPLVNATVYVAQQSIVAQRSISLSTAPTTCDYPQETFSQFTCTDEEGAFSLTLENVAEAQITVKKGVFLTSFQVTVRDSANGALNVGSRPVADTTAGLPKIAVVTGFYDRMQDVLAKSGLGNIDAAGNLIIGTEQFDLFDGDLSLGSSYPSFSTLLDIRVDGQPKLFDYDILFINCGAYEMAFDIGLSPTDPETIAALRSYVQAGGRLYVTDLAYDFIEQAFPEYLNFHGGDIGPSTQAELPDAAEVGLVLDSVSGTVLDSSLRAFLTGADCEGEPCLSNQTVQIEGFLGGWSVIDGVHAEKADHVKLLINGAVDTADGEGEVKPLTVVFEHGLGKVMYSSYHTEDRGSQGFLPQERVLQFLIFE